MTAPARTLALAERRDAPPQSAPGRFVMSRPIFALSVAFAIGIAIGAITKEAKE